jgi:hypothetical protein
MTPIKYWQKRTCESSELQCSKTNRKTPTQSWLSNLRTGLTTIWQNKLYDSDMILVKTSRIRGWLSPLEKIKFNAENKSKRIPSIFNDESTETFICLRRHIYMSHVNKVQPIRVKMICIAAIRVTCMKDFVSVVKILLKAFFFCSLIPYPPPHNPRSMRLTV